MANDIAAQFRHLPEDVAVAAVAAHLRQFWEPRMRQQLSEAVADPDGAGAGLDPLVLAAASHLS